MILFFNNLCSYFPENFSSSSFLLVFWVSLFKNWSIVTSRRCRGVLLCHTERYNQSTDRARYLCFSFNYWCWCRFSVIPNMTILSTKAEGKCCRNVIHGLWTQLQLSGLLLPASNHVQNWRSLFEWKTKCLRETRKLPLPSASARWVQLLILHRCIPHFSSLWHPQLTWKECVCFCVLVRWTKIRSTPRRRRAWSESISVVLPQ